MTKMVALSLALLLGGCATVGETMANKEPSLAATTSKSPTQYRDCMIQSTALAVWSISEIDGGFMFVSTKVSGNVITARDYGQGTEIKVWGLLGTRNAARSCV